MSKDTRVSQGMRIKYHQEGDLKISAKTYNNGKNFVRVVIDIGTCTYRLVDPASGVTLKAGGGKEQGINNLEVLMRKAKKALKDFMGVHFEKETRVLKTEVPTDDSTGSN